jgi:hypothetical protein
MAMASSANRPRPQPAYQSQARPQVYQQPVVYAQQPQPVVQQAQPVYAPQQAAYAPQQPAYAPQQPAYAPQSVPMAAVPVGMAAVPVGQVPMTAGGGIMQHSGWMTKRGGFVANWQRRWFTLYGQTLKYSASAGGQMKGMLQMGQCRAVRPSTDSARAAFEIEVVMPQRTYVFRAGSDSEYRTWMHVLQSARGGVAMIGRGMTPVAAGTPAQPPIAVAASAPPAASASGYPGARQSSGEAGRKIFQDSMGGGV